MAILPSPPQSSLNDLPPHVATALAQARILARENLDLTLTHLPVEMKQLPHWIVWAFAARQNKSGEWKITKEPYIAQLDAPRLAASNRPQEWRTLQAALAVLKQDWARKNGGFYDGLGFMFQGSGYSGVDLDHILQADGVIAPWAKELLASFGHTYIERSVRGEGLHAILGSNFMGGGVKQEFRDGSGFELYCTGRYFAITGKPYNGSASVIAAYDVQSLHDRFKRGEIGPDDFRAEQSAKAQKRSTAPKRVINVAAFIERYNIPINGTNAETTFTRYSITCPGCSAKDAYILQHHDGGVSMGCYHASCAFSKDKGDHWQAFSQRYPLKDEPKTRAKGDSQEPNADNNAADNIDLLFGDPKFSIGDLGNAERFLRVYGRDVLHDPRKDGQWFLWDSMCWKPVDEVAVRELMHDVFKRYVKQAVDYRCGDEEKEEAVRKRAYRSLTTAGITSALKEAKPYIHVHIEDFDENNYLLNFTNGTLDLETDELRRPRREDRISKLVPFDYVREADSPEFCRFLFQLMGGNLDADVEQPQVAALVESLEQTFGLALTGDTSEKLVFVFNGPTDTGKTTLLQLIRELLGDYATCIPIEALMTKERNNSTEEQLFLLHGVRFAMTSETARNQRLAVARLKQITQGGNAIIQVTPKFKPTISFRERHKLFMDCNFKPKIWGDDDALWRRIRITPFGRQFTPEEQDKDKKAKLLKEGAGIMARLVRAYQRYRKNGSLPTTQEMTSALEDWKQDSVVLAEFFAENCELTQDGKGEVLMTTVWRRYTEWCEQNRDERLHKETFYAEIEKMGAKRERQRTRVFRGLLLKAQMQEKTA